MEDADNKTEMDTFIQQGENNFSDGSLKKYKVQVIPQDVEGGRDGKSFDPFTERRVDNPTTDCDTLIHLLKASLGTGILAMPYAFSKAGLVFGIAATIVVAFICTYCAHMLIQCAHILYHRTNRTSMTFADVAEVAFATGPRGGKILAKPSRWLIQISLFVTYFGTCSVYTVIMAENINRVIFQQTDMVIDIRRLILFFMIPLILLSWVPNLKYLAPCSMLANLLMGTGLGITFYYLLTNIPAIKSEDLMGNIGDLPAFCGITIFAMEAIGVVMPLENSMKTPQNLVGVFGVLSKGMSSVTVVYILLGFLGFLKYGSKTEDVISHNLEIAEVPAQIVNVFIALAVYFTFGLQFYVCLEIGWDSIKDKFKKHNTLANYGMRTFMVIGVVLLAVMVPTIGPFVGLLGAFCFSILGLLIPAVIETITYWEIGFGRGNWIIIKNIIIVVIGLIAMITGSWMAIEEIIKKFSGK